MTDKARNPGSLAGLQVIGDGAVHRAEELLAREAVERRVLDPHPGLDVARVDLPRVLRDQALHLSRLPFRGGGGGVHASMSRSGRAVENARNKSPEVVPDMPPTRAMP